MMWSAHIVAAGNDRRLHEFHRGRTMTSLVISHRLQPSSSSIFVVAIRPSSSLSLATREDTIMFPVQLSSRFAVLTRRIPACLLPCSAAVCSFGANKLQGVHGYQHLKAVVLST
jgi:hypothetical protein